MKHNYSKLILKLSLIFLSFAFKLSYSQCSLTYYAGIGVANSGTAFATWSNFGPGQYFAFPVLNGGSYAVSTCGASIDTQLTGWDPTVTSVVFFNDDNGPLCTSTSASVDGYVPNFTNYMYVQVCQFNCIAGGSSSINLYLRQNDNLAFTSSAASMCSGQARSLSATPANVGFTPGGYGNAGTFSGTGVSGNVFTAPTVASPTNYTITYTFGYVSHTQVITVNPLPTVVANTSTTQVCRNNSVTLTGSGASTYAWSGGVTNNTAFAPASTVAYTVTGTSLAGCTSTNLSAVTVTVNARPTVVANTTTTQVCQNGFVSLSGSGASTYAWTGGVTNNVGFAPTSTQSYSVVGTSSAGCTSTNTASVSVTVNLLPIVTASTSTTQLCRGSSVTLTGGSANTYAWSGGVTNGVAFAPTSTQAYTVVGTSTAGCTSTNVAAVTVTVNATPTVVANTTTTQVCQNGTVTLSGSGASTYAWSGGVTNNLAFAPITTQIYTVTGTSTAGCTSTNVASVGVTVNAIPFVTASSSTIQVCQNGLVTLNGGGASTYAWTGGAVNNVAFAPTATQIYTVTGTSSAGCTSTNLATVSLTVNLLPIVTASTSTSQVCQNGSVTLTGGGATTYAWTGGVTNNLPFVPTSTQIYSVTGTSTAGCTSTNVAAVTVNVNAIPSLSIIASSPSICINNTVSLSGSGASTYIWTGGITNGVAFSPVTTSSYSVSGTSSAGCTSTLSAGITVTVINLPTVTANTSTTAVCAGNSVTLNGGGASTYIWTGGAVDGVPFAPAVTFTYSLAGTNTAGCTSTNVANVSVTVNALPTLTINASSTAICINNSETLTATGANTYTWTGGVVNGVSFSPTSTTSYSVTGNSTAGCTNTVASVVTITVNPLPLVTANTSSAVICKNNTTTVYGGGANTYVWTGGVTDGVAFSPASSTVYTVTGTSSAGCTSTNVATTTITVNNLPVVTANTSTTAVCAGNSVILTGNGANTYTWSGGVSDGVAFVPGSTLTYFLSGTSTAGCTSTNVANVTVTVNTLPTLTINASSTAICINNSEILTATGANTYVWTNGVINGVSFSPTSTASYSVTGTSTAGCTNTVASVITITVNPLPFVTANTSSAVICRNNTTTVYGGGANTYTWTGGILDAIAFSPTSTVTYDVTGTSTAGCTSTNVAAVTITVNSLPLVSASSNTPAICINGSVTLTGGGATTYTWSNGVTDGVSFFPVSTNIYTVSGTNTNSCQNSATVAVAVNPLPTVTANSTYTFICINTPIVLSGGGASTYTWVASSGTATNGISFSPTITADYSVTGTSTAGCTSTNVAAITVTVNSLPIVTASTSSAVICYGNSITLSGGGANTYTWTNGALDGVAFSPTASTIYSVTGTSTAGCTSTNVVGVSITVYNLPILTVVTSSASICLNNTVTVTASGASTYTWTGGITNGITFTPTATSGYTVTATDTHSCVNTASTNIVVNPIPTVTAGASNTFICINQSVTLNGGGAYTYTWTSSSGSFTDNTPFYPTTTKSYSVVGKSLAGCTSINAAAVTITVNLLPIVSAATSSAVICFNNTITLTGSGANTYTWTNGALDGVAFSPTATTYYSVIGTSTANCTSTNVAGVNITVHALPTLTISGSAVICNTGSSTLAVSGASTYTWSTASTSNSVVLSPTVNTTYTVTGTDLNSCQNSAVETVTVSSLPVVTANTSSAVICLNNTIALIGGGAITYTWSSSSGIVANPTSFAPAASTTYSVVGSNISGCTSTNLATVSITVNPLPSITIVTTSSAICINNTVAVTASGANTYVWSGGVTDGVAFSPTATATYTATGTDSNSCQNTSIVSITVNPLPIVTAVANHTSICINQQVILTGGNATTYTWTSSTGTLANNTAFSPTVTDSYSVIGTSSAGCTGTDVAVVTITVNSLPTVSASTSTTSVCAGGNIILTGSGAASYTWTSSTGIVSDGVPFAPPISDTYSLTGSNAAGCTNTNLATVAITVNPLPTLTAQTTSAAICLGNAITLTGAGATNYTWTSTVASVTDGVAFSPTSTGIYSVSGVDANACVGTATINIDVNPIPTVTASASNTFICINGSVTLNGNGASTYTWTSSTGPIANATAFYPTATDSYSVVGTSSAGCTSSNIAIVTITVNTLPVVIASTSTASVCAGNSVILSGSGATTYTWASSTGTVSNGIAFAPSATDSYSVTGTSTAGCTSTNVAAVVITVHTLPAITANASSTAVCLGRNLTLTGGGATSFYTWAAPTGTVEDGVTFIPGASAVYTVSGADSFGCQNSATISILSDPIPTISASSSSTVVCHGGTLTLNGGGATTYTWSSGSSTPVNGVAFVPAASGSYSVTGTSVAGCIGSNTAVISIIVNPLPTVTASIVNAVICYGGTTAVNAGGAVTYNWSNGLSNSSAFTPSQTATYTVTGTDANSCKNTATVDLTVNALPVLTIVSNRSVSCEGEPTTLTIHGASTYTWTGLNTTTAAIDITPTITSTYAATGTDANGCVGATSFTQLVSPCNATLLAVPEMTNVSCGANHDGKIVINSTIVSQNYSVDYIWTSSTNATLCPAKNCSTLDSLAEGSYSVTVKLTYTINNTFVKTDSVKISDIKILNVNGPCNLDVYTGITPNSDRANDVLFIRNITEYPKNKVTVFNRWGEKIFESNGYNNKDNAWPQGSDVDKIISATYFYIIDLGDGSKPVKGWVEVMK